MIRNLRIFVALPFIFLAFLSQAQTGIAIPNTTAVTENFNSMAATTNLPTGWRFRINNTGTPTYWGTTVATVTQQASTGSPATGGTYNWGSSTSERAVGAMTSGGFATHNNLMVKYRNTGASNISALAVSFNYERYRRNTAAASVLFFYSTNGSTWTAATAGNITYNTGTSTYSMATPNDSSRSVSITGLSVAPNDSLFLRWSFQTTGSNSQGIGVDNVSVTATFASAPEMDVRNTGGTSIADNDATPTSTDSTDFGSADVTSGLIYKTFTIYNTGSSSLSLSATPIVGISGTHSSDFSIVTQPSSSIAAGGNSSFVVSFNPSATGVRSASLSITNNDANENPYNFSIQGTGTAAAPEIGLRMGGGSYSDIANGDVTPSTLDFTDFGNANTVADTVAHPFHVYNSGGADLNLTGASPYVTISGTHASDFTLTYPPGASPIISGDYRFFWIKFDPSGAGVRTATISIANDDSDENPYTFSIQGTGIQPTVAGSPSSLTGFSYSSGSGPSAAQSISVSGTNLAANLVVNGTAAYDVSLSSGSGYGSSVSIAPTSGTVASTTVYFRLKAGLATATYNQTATITSTGATTVNISLSGAVNAALSPEMGITGNSNVISDGDVTPSATDHTDFGNAQVTGGTVVRTFTIANSGTADLTLSGIPMVAISGTHASDFTVSLAPSPTITSSSSTTFQVTFDPSASGVRTASISISNNDSDEDPYNFDISGTGIVPVVAGTPTSLSSFSYVEGAGPSAAQSISVSGSNLTANLVVNGTAAYDVSLSSGSGYGSSVSIAPTSGTVASTTVYFRLKTGLVAATYNQTATITSTNATTVNISLNGSVSATCNQLMISEYHEGTGNNKYLELFNPTSSSINLASYQLVQYNNGSASPTYTLALSGTLAAYSTYVIENSSEGLSVAANVSTTNQVMTFNGNDAIALQTSGGTNIDVIGTIGSSANFAVDVDLRRNATVTLPVTTYNASEWTSTAANAVSNFGVHTSNCACSGPTTNASSVNASSILSTSATIGWTIGNGSNRVAIVKSGSAVTGSPSYGTSYLGNAVFGSGQTIAGSEFAVYNGTGTSVPVTGLSANTTYHVEVFEYNASPDSCYKTDGTGNTTSFTTSCNTPTTQASSVTVPAIGGTTMTINFAAGNGSNRLVVVKSGSAVAGTPSNTSYTANTVFGTGGVIAAGEYVVYNSTGTSVSITGLTAGTTYHIKVFEFNSPSNCVMTTGTGNTASATTVSAETDVVAVASSETATVPTTTTGTITTSTNGAQVWQFTIREGGSDLTDADALPTIVNSIVLTQNAGNQIDDWSDAINQVALFDGTTLLGYGVVTANQITFSASPLITVADGASKTLSVRLTLQTNINNTGGNNDNDDFVFNLTNANFTTASSGSSSKSAFAVASSTNGQNVVTVTATKLIFYVQPSNASALATMVPSPVVRATDANNNLDTDFSGTISITSDGSMLSSPQTATPASGAGTFLTIIHSVSATGRILTATATGLTSALSSQFDILNTTVFKPGELVMIGFDANYDGGGADRIFLMNTINMLPNTNFLWVNSRFEPGAAANTRTNRWGGPGDDPYQDPSYASITYTGASTLAAGAVIGVDFSSGTIAGISVNNGSSYSADWAWSVSGGSPNISTSEPDQLYVVQGAYVPYGTAGVSRYNLLTGNVLYGITLGNSWIPFGTAVSAGTSGGSTRQSRLPEDILCFNFESPTQSGYAYYENNTGLHNGSKRQIFKDLRNFGTNWTIGSGSSGVDITEDYTSPYTTAAIGEPFTLSAGNAPGTYIGDASGNPNDWFDCGNWESYTVPDSTVDVFINSYATANVQVDVSASSLDRIFNGVATCKNITIDGKELRLAGDAADSLVIYGDLTMTATSGTTLDMSDGNSVTPDGKIILNGSWINNAAETDFKQGNSTVEFHGTETEIVQIAGTGKEIFHNLIIRKPSNHMYFYDSVRVENNLYMYGGNIYSDTGVVEIGNGTGASSTYKGTLTRSSGYIVGAIRRWFNGTNTGDASGLFPFGYIKAGSLVDRSVLIEYSGAPSTGGSVRLDWENGAMWDSGLYIYGVNAAGSCDTFTVEHTYDNGYWRIDNDAATLTDGQYKITITGETIDGITELCKLTILKRVGTGAWTTPGTHLTNTGTIAKPILSRSGVSGYSNFGFGGGRSNPLPVVLSSFTAVAINNSYTSLDWTTLLEINSDRFVVQHSKDGVNFETIGVVKGQGNTTSATNYHFEHTKPASGWNYYRLVQVDFDGAYENSVIRPVNYTGEGLQVILYPNPVESSLQIFSADENSLTTKIEVLNIQGQTVLTQSMGAPESKVELNLTNLASGLYYIKVDSKAGTVLHKFMKK